MSRLSERLDALARAPVLVVACDFDGTLAPIVDDHRAARPDREALVALRALSDAPQTHVAVISGRALNDLALRTAEVPNVHLVGSHGSEFDPGFAERLSSETRALRTRLVGALESLLARFPGCTLEIKPASVAFHYRGATGPVADGAVQAIQAGPGRWQGVSVRHGKKVIELGVTETDKGKALERIRQRFGASAVIFLGDDVTDEDAFATLGGPDVGIKVGPGETRAEFRAADTTEAARILARLAESRAAWLAGARAVPIEHHALLSDQRTTALIAPATRIVWMCLPRFDSPALFAELIGGPAAGFFEISPAGEDRLSDSSGEARAAPAGRYIGDSFVVESRWAGLRVRDYLDCTGGRAFQRAGRTELVRVIEGRGAVRVTFSPRLDFGRTPTRIHVCDGGLEIEGAVDPIVLAAPGVQWRLREEGPHQTAVGEIHLDGAPCVLELRYGTANLAPAQGDEALRRSETEQFWSSWAATLTLPRIAPDLCRRSALVLKALCYGPTGAMAAAATTSLPEHPGGARNWDYRYCWPRDAAMAAAALVRLGAVAPAMKFLDWVLGVLERCESPDRLRPVYTVSGGHLAPEAEISGLAGYLGSRPVRVGNAAALQVQLDVFGVIADLVALLGQRQAPLSSEHWRIVEMMVDAVRRRWREPDDGIWEPRLPKRHHVHSKVMCWQTVDRALDVAAYLGQARPDWPALRDEIAADVLERGWRPDVGSFSAVYDDDAVDAASLCIGLSGLLPPDDPRFVATVGRVERGLLVGPTVYRYRYDDGLPGGVAGFHLCTSWLIEVYCLLGRFADAALLFEQYVGLVGETGLLAETYDPRTRRALGNYPQAYSHLGLINAAVRLSTGPGSGGD